jgi:hypothetical protein
LAAAEEPANYRKGIERLAAGFGEMRAAPRRNEPAGSASTSSRD